MNYELNKECAATVGFFDGVHRGHRFLIDQVREVAEKHGVEPAVVTFSDHPRRVLHTDYQPQMLTTPEEKVRLIREAGIDRCCMLTFDRQMAEMSARDFMLRVLKERLGVRYLVIGYDNRFGHNRREGFDDYVGYGREMGIEVVRAQALEKGGVRISSSVVRTLLSGGEVELAAQCLGYRYTVSGTVVGGFQEGRRMGFPTANIDMGSVEKMVPAAGVYAMTANVGDGKTYPAMMNIGRRPTFGGENTTMEVNIIGYSGNLYGRRISVSFVRRIRQERRFPSEKALMAQLEKDKEEVVRILGL